MIKPSEILEFNRILQDKCDDCEDCSECPLGRTYPQHGCLKDNLVDKREAKRLINFVYGNSIKNKED